MKWYLILADYEATNIVMPEYPMEISIYTPLGELVLRNCYRDGCDYEYGGELCEQDGIKLFTRFRIDEDYGHLSASVQNTISDANETLYWSGSNEERVSEWSRVFRYENESLNGIIGQVSNAINETYNEWAEYVASSRDYESRSRGRGKHAETVNSNNWEYYAEDSPEYIASTRKARTSRSFNSMVKSQRAKNKH